MLSVVCMFPTHPLLIPLVYIWNTQLCFRLEVGFWASTGISARPGCSCNLPGLINSLSVYNGLLPCTAVIVVEETTSCMFLMQYCCVTVMSAETVLAVGLNEIIEARLNFLSRIGEGATERHKPVRGWERERESGCSLSVIRCRTANAKSCWWDADEEMNWKRAKQVDGLFIDNCRTGL